jgi:hypothetical protein
MTSRPTFSPAVGVAGVAAGLIPLERRSSWGPDDERSPSSSTPAAAVHVRRCLPVVSINSEALFGSAGAWSESISLKAFHPTR